jgi:hypothetical protein
MSIASQLAVEDRIYMIALVVAAVAGFVLWRIGDRLNRQRAAADAAMERRLRAVAAYLDCCCPPGACEDYIASAAWIGQDEVDRRFDAIVAPLKEGAE